MKGKCDGRKKKKNKELDSSAKVFEASTLVERADQRKKDYKNLKEKLQTLKTACLGVADLGDDFTGKGADNIKEFFRGQAEVVDSWITLADMQISFFNGVSGDIEAKKLPDSYIEMSFLKTELKNADKKSDQIVDSLKSSMDRIIDRVSDIVDLDKWTDHNYTVEMSKAQTTRENAIDAVDDLDKFMTGEYTQALAEAESVSKKLSALMEATSNGKSASPMYFDKKAFHSNKLYKEAIKTDKQATTYINAKKEQAEARRIAELQEKLANVSDPDEYVKMAKEIGYNNLSPEQQEYVKSLEEEDVSFWEHPIDYVSEKLDDFDDGVINLIETGEEKLKEVLAPVDEAGKKYLGSAYDYAKGITVARYDFVKETLEGVVTLNKFVRNSALHPVRTANSIIEFDYKKAWNSAWDEVKEKWDKNFVHGDLYSRTHYAEYLKLNIVTTFISGGAGAASKGASIASKAGRFASAAGKSIVKQGIKGAGKTAIKQGIKGAGHVGIVVGNRVVKDLKEVGELIKKGLIKIGDLPNPVAREILVTEGIPIHALTLRQSGHEMIQFIKKSFDHFTSPKGGKAHGGDGIKKTPKGDHGGEPKVPHKSKPKSHESIQKVEKNKEATKSTGKVTEKHEGKNVQKGKHGDGDPKTPHQPKSKSHEPVHKVDKHHESTKGAENVSGKHPHESSKPRKHESGKDVDNGTKGTRNLIGKTLKDRANVVRTKLSDSITAFKSSDEYLNLSNTQRKKIDRKIKSLTKGNVATADVNIPGIRNEFTAHSQIILWII
ncbi:ribonuclease YeeF family protein [Bacillus sp. WMMC1349]|uniref:ribonuclease YeeF family protein n=1 Tax=Bacillus sp. WMMC1349 TaxID=2736254 RepID=UPI0020A64B70|nr:T7SS effector LXG polymorphic toxin [Bacillus sp. WMMC1349]